MLKHPRPDISSFTHFFQVKGFKHYERRKVVSIRHKWLKKPFIIKLWKVDE